MLSLHDQSRGPWILLHVALDKGRFNMTVCGRYTPPIGSPSCCSIEAWGSYWSWDPKETWALITWIIFATYLHSRITKGWEGKKTAIIGSIGFFVIWICYLGVNFLGKGLHSYGWVS